MSSVFAATAGWLEDGRKAKYNIKSIERQTSPRSAPYVDNFPVPPSIQRLHAPKTFPHLPLQVWTQRIPPTGHPPAPSNHQHPIGIERLRLPHGRSGNPKPDCVHRGHSETVALRVCVLAHRLRSGERSLRRTYGQCAPREV